MEEPAMAKTTITAFTRVEAAGWTAMAYEIAPFTGAAPAAEDFTFEGVPSKVRSAAVKDGVLRLEIDPSPLRDPFTITGAGLTIRSDGADETKTEWADKFEDHRDHDIVYRLYAPQAYSPRPLVLFLHGGGECGDDNWRQMVCTVGAAKIAEDYPDCFVMAPQAPRGLFNVATLPPEQARKLMNRPFAESDQKGENGWHRAYLGKVCDVIRELIAQGRVLASRVYVTGLSMGGAGTIRAMSVGSDLFAAAAPICPSMTPETYNILKGMTHAKVWVSTAYVDHTIYRHKYIADAIMSLQNAGNKDAYLTLYSPEELAAYGMGVNPDLSLKELFSENHGSWNLTYNNEYGIMSWLLNQTKG
jgi:predicted peptidase